ncbi:hypothetical protein JEM67_02220 [Serratia sp. PAMC26656]|uniref:hypothetical protein n=1 Tax=Serratia sp. PAMC26656 TaxID=2775909 RepID=UPI0018F754D7|nr:hypothetical protein [Serratia sp. PAMC26656]MBJ7893343.1 hypothetical protein [Serratia sp. PAMC26656]
MSQTRDQQAYQRGIWAARKWTRLKDTIMRWDRRCVAKARKHRFPGWIGHIPMIMLATSILAAVAFGGLFIASLGIIISAIILIASLVFEPLDEQNSRKSTFEYKTYGEFGPGWYSGKTKISDGNTSPYDYRR